MGVIYRHETKGGTEDSSEGVGNGYNKVKA